ncbi:Putative TonB-dependent receptor BfrD [Sphingomonas antarctica]|uniref:TonB-dependent receptor n=1 Tax=Sphingomonas antarctica TaxID=2040274 RepID=UPI0039ED2224
MSHRLPSFLALSCVGFINSAPAFAADDADAATDENTRNTIIVTGTREQLDSPKAIAPLINTPRSIVTVDKEIIKDTGSATLIDALRTVPGITFGAAEGGNPIGDRPFIRGFDSQGSIFLDGVRDIGAQTREVFAVEQIQIVRGSDSTLGGRGSAGGSLNIISRLPTGREDFISGGISYGTDDYKRVTGDVNYRIGEHVGFRIQGMYHDQDFAGRDAIFARRWGVAPSLTIGLGTPTRLTLAYYHLSTHELPDSGIPFLYTIANTPNTGYSYSQPAIGNITTIGGQTGTVDRDTFYGLKDRDFRDSKQDQATIRFDHDFGNGLKFRNTSRFSHTYQAYIFLLPDDSTGDVFGTSPTNTATGGVTNFVNGGYVWRRANTRQGTTDSLINQTDFYGTFDTGSIKHSFSVGTELSWEDTQRGTFVTRGFTNAAGTELLSTGSTITPRCNATTIARHYCTSLFNPNPNDPWVNYASDTSNIVAPIVKSQPIADTLTDADTKAAYAFDSITVTNALIVNLGLRYDRFHSKVRPGLPVTVPNPVRYAVDRTDELWNYQVGAVFKPAPNVSVYASHSTAAVPPNSLVGEGQEQNGLGTITVPAGSNATALQIATAQAVSDSLKVERTKSYEVGAKADLFDNKLSLTAALFKTETRNARVTSDANTVTFIGKREIKGIELGFNGRPTEAWSIFGGYTYLDARITDGGFTALTAAAIMNGAVVVQAAKTVQVVSVNTGRQFPQTAKHSFTLWTDYKVLPGLSIGGGAFYTSRVFGGYADNRAATQNAAGVVTVSPATKIIARSVPDYWRFDARVGYTINKNLDVSVNLQNLTDKVYFSQVYTNHYAAIAPGRSAFATLNFKY